MLSDICSDFLRINEDIAENGWANKTVLIRNTLHTLHEDAKGYDWADYGIERDAIIAASAAALAQPDLFLDTLKELAAMVRTFHDHAMFEGSEEREAAMNKFAQDVLLRCSASRPDPASG